MDGYSGGHELTPEMLLEGRERLSVPTAHFILDNTQIVRGFLLRDWSVLDLEECVERGRSRQDVYGKFFVTLDGEQ